MMTRDEAVARIARGLGFRTDLDEMIRAALMEAQRELEIGTSLPWFLLLEDQALTIPAGVSRVDLPANFIREYEIQTMHYEKSTTLEEALYLKKVDEKTLYEARSWQAPGRPITYALGSSALIFKPEADQEYIAKWNYYGRAEPLASNIENVWLAKAPELLIGTAGLSLATDLRNRKAMEVFGAMQMKWARLVHNENVARQEAARQRFMTGGR